MKYFVFEHVEQTQSPVCGRAMLNPGWCHMERRLDHETVLIFGKKNTTLLDCNGTEIEVKPGRMVILPARFIHKGKKAIDQAVSYYWIHFFQGFETEHEAHYYLPYEIAENDALSVLSSPHIAYRRMENSILLPQYIDVENQVLFNRLCNEILQEYKKPQFSPLIYRSLVENLLIELFKECFSNKGVKDNASAGNTLVSKLMVLIEDELSNTDASVKYFAQILKVNQDYLGRCFKEVMKISIGQYISQRRVELSCQRLRETFDSIEQIYVQCGFGSRRQFYDEFKKITGKTPSLYRTESSVISINTL